MSKGDQVGESRRGTTIAGDSDQNIKWGLTRGAFFACLALVGCLALAASAPAATVYAPTGGEFTGSQPLVGSIAVDDATGDVIGPYQGFESPDGLPGLAVYGPEGPGSTLLGVFPEPELGVPGSVAIDQTARSIYVQDDENARIEKFTIAGSGALTFTPDVTFTSPTQGSGPGQIGSLPSALAVDPTTGDLLVADRENGRVSRFAPDGSFISSFDGSGSSAGTFHALTGIAVNPSGQIYVVDVIEFAGNPNGVNKSVLERFTASGDPEKTFAPAIDTPLLVGADPENGNVVVAGGAEGVISPYSPARLYVIHGNAILQEIDVAGGGLRLVGIAGGAGRLYFNLKHFFLFEGDGIHIFEGIIAPDINVNAPSAVTPDGATISGTINPLGNPTTFHLEYSREGGPPKETAETPIGEGNQPEQFSVALTGLIANSEYTVRVVGTNLQTSITSPPTNFKTPVAPPAAETGSAPNPTSGSAVLTGTVNPFGEQTTYYFEYGPTTSYGDRAPVTREAVAGNGRDPLQVSQEVLGLLPESTYHFRLVAKNATGVSIGEDRSFVTAAAATVTRAYELVTPNEKRNSNTDQLYLHASKTGDAVTYEMQNVIPGITKAFPKYPRYTSTRVDGQWETAGLEPQNVQTFNETLLFADVLAVSEDNTTAVVATGSDLAPGGIRGGTNLYRYDIATGTYETILGNPDPAGLNAFVGLQSFGAEVVVGGTPNFSRLYFTNGDAPTFELVPGVAPESVFEWTVSGGLKVIAEHVRAPSGFDFTGDIRSAREPRMVSEDGSVAFFINEELSLSAIYHGSVVAVSQGSAAFIGASADGRYVFYEEYGDATLYRYDLLTSARIAIAEGGGGFGVSADGSTVYFSASGPAGGNALWIWREGNLRLVAEEIGVPIYHLKSASPNGRYMVFASKKPLTGYDSGGVAELYRYDADTEVLTCASCRTDGQRPVGEPQAGEIQGFFEFYMPRVVLNNGEVFFDTPDPLVPSDVNNRRDVYSFDGVRQTLISTGTGNADSYFGDASESGNDVFFTTATKLVKGDTNDDVDLYDARVGGGIQSQNTEASVPECYAGTCRAVGGAPPPSPAVGSEAVSANGRRTVRPAKKACPMKPRVKAKKTKAAKCVKGHGHKKSSHKKRGHGR
jgi:hypothetical protein